MELPVKAGVGAAIIKDGKILLIRRIKEPEADYWSLIGGKIDFGETTQAAIIRETQEEIGVLIKEPFLLCISDLIGEDYHWISPIYLINDYEGIPKIQEPHKHSALEWFALDNLPPNISQAVSDTRDALVV